MDPRFNGSYDSVSSIEFEDGMFYPNFFDPPDFSNGYQFGENHIMDRNFMDSLDDIHSNPVLKCINQILLEENMDERPSMFFDPLALRETEKSLYDALDEKYPSPHHSEENPDPHSVVDPGIYKSLPVQSSNGKVDVLAYNNLVPTVYNDTKSILQFQKGMEAHNMENEVKDDCFNGSRGRKNSHWVEEESVLEEQRCSKQSVIYVEEEVEISELLDKFSVSTEPKIVSNGSNPDNVNSGKNRSRRKANKTEAIDLSTLLLSCAQSIADNDLRAANELLKKIRQSSSECGDAWQRLAHVLANGLEARLAGTGTCLYARLKSRKCSAAEMLKAFELYLSASPFKLIPIFFANEMIADLASKAEAVHIVDLGIRYGFQWPVLIQHLSTLPGGPPRLRITGIDYPQPGFRPEEGVVDAGKRLAKYCDVFGVPFEYQAIAIQNWEEIKVKDLKLRNNEVLVVNSLFRFQNLLDETYVEDCPRDMVLKLIRAMNPNLFVNAVISGSYNSPFFVRRFREALYHYSSLFDMLDCTIPREDEQRLKFEQEFYGRDILSVVSCEGLDRVERPETYKQWQTRHLRAGLKPIPLEKKIMNMLRDMVRKGYHKDFIFDEDGCWMLQGWKGRIICASSCWIPA